jgi:hypothetical protein
MVAFLNRAARKTVHAAVNGPIVWTVEKQNLEAVRLRRF